MIGLEVEGKPLLRAYSVASPNYEEHLEFLSIKVQDGPSPHVCKKFRWATPFSLARSLSALWLLMISTQVSTSTYLVLALAWHPL